MQAASLNPIIGYEPTLRRANATSAKHGDAATLASPDAAGIQPHRLPEPHQMASIAFMEGYHYIPRIDKEVLERTRKASSA